MKLWGGRFSEPAAETLRRLNDSFAFDRRMYAQDIAGSIAYARALVGAGILTSEETEKIVSGLEQVRAEFDAGTFEAALGDEDIHTAVERRLTEIVGIVGGKLHTGRSRNDQVATDLRLWTMEAVREVRTMVMDLQSAFIDQSKKHVEVLMPGYTHLQPAQPITVAHWLMSFYWMLHRDRARLSDALKRISVMPLGSGALAGTPLSIDRSSLMKDLSFTSYSQNSLDAVSDRDFVAETLFALALMGTHLSRFAEDILIYTNPAFGFIALDERYSTGSSLMPQKRNADPMELARGKVGRMIGSLTGMMTTLKGLPTGYNKDLQEDKEALFDSIDTMLSLLPVITAVVETLTVNTSAMRDQLSDDMLATDLADYLVAKGLPFRDAHHVIGQIVQIASDREKSLSELELDDLTGVSDLFGEDVSEVFDFKKSVERRSAPGGTAPSAVLKQIYQAEKFLVE